MTAGAPPPAHPPRPQLGALTGVRFFAAVAVVFHHFGADATASFPWPVRNAFAVGFVGVNLFFVLSGFVLAYVYQPGRRPIDARDFVAARVARIGPLYVTALALGAPLFVSALYARVPPAVATMKLVAASILRVTMTQAWVGQVGTWNIPDWSLSCEWFFYLAFPVLVPPLLALARSAKPLVVLGAIWVAAVAPTAAHHALHPQYPGAESLFDWTTTMLKYAPYLRVLEFLFGAVLADAWMASSWSASPSSPPRPREGLREGAARPRSVDARSGALATAAAAALLALLSFGTKLPLLPLHDGLLTPLFGALVVGLASGGGALGRALSWGPLVLLGEASYGVYILHWPLHEILARTSVLGDRAAASGWGFWVYLGVVVASSIAAYYGIERPLRGVVRAAIARPRADRPMEAKGAAC